MFRGDHEDAIIDELYRQNTSRFLRLCQLQASEIHKNTSLGLTRGHKPRILRHLCSTSSANGHLPHTIHLPRKAWSEYPTSVGRLALWSMTSLPWNSSRCSATNSCSGVLWEFSNRRYRHVRDTYSGFVPECVNAIWALCLGSSLTTASIMSPGTMISANKNPSDPLKGTSQHATARCVTVTRTSPFFPGKKNTFFTVEHVSPGLGLSWTLIFRFGAGRSECQLSWNLTACTARVSKCLAEKELKPKSSAGIVNRLSMIRRFVAVDQTHRSFDNLCIRLDV